MGDVTTALSRRAEVFHNRLDTPRRLENSLLEFRRCINAAERLAFVHEDARTSSAA
jgi:hypothetical protein